MLAAGLGVLTVLEVLVCTAGATVWLASRGRQVAEASCLGIVLALLAFSTVTQLAFIEDHPVASVPFELAAIVGSARILVEHRAAAAGLLRSLVRFAIEHPIAGTSLGLMGI